MGQKPTCTQGWWYARYRMRWPESEEPAWHIDLLIAHRIIAPLICQHTQDILFWRFHRRAARDIEGHQFSFTFYASQETAQRIFDTLRSNMLIKKLIKGSLITLDIYDDTKKITVPRIEDTSDGHWKAPIRHAWPFFIMGICQMWLALIEEIAEHSPQKHKLTSIKNLTGFYRQVNQEINALWREQGGHAFLHHLNAIFGYEPVIVREVNVRRF